MARKKEMVAMLLAGGQGTRLQVLTQDMAKPAVPYGGKYRIIDFPLSNCANSGISTVGVLTQFKPLELNSYMGNGQPWDLDRMDGGLSILPPYTAGKTGEWYKGTAHAIYQNIKYIEQYEPDYVLILSGDHIYKMNYNKMLEFHKEKEADLTIAHINVPMEEAHRFGILNTDEDLRIVEFLEKPENPVSTKASMGIYIFNWRVLREYLIRDEANPESEKDFGKNIIPMLLEEDKKIFAFPQKVRPAPAPIHSFKGRFSKILIHILDGLVLAIPISPILIMLHPSAKQSSTNVAPICNARWNCSSSMAGL